MVSFLVLVHTGSTQPSHTFKHIFWTLQQITHRFKLNFFVQLPTLLHPSFLATHKTSSNFNWIPVYILLKSFRNKKTCNELKNELYKKVILTMIDENMKFLRIVIKLECNWLLISTYTILNYTTGCFKKN